MQHTINKLQIKLESNSGCKPKKKLNISYYFELTINDIEKDPPLIMKIQMTETGEINKNHLLIQKLSLKLSSQKITLSTNSMAKGNFCKGQSCKNNWLLLQQKIKQYLPNLTYSSEREQIKGSITATPNIQKIIQQVGEHCLLCIQKFQENQQIPRVFHNDQGQRIIYMEKKQSICRVELQENICALMNEKSGGIVIIGTSILGKPQCGKLVERAFAQGINKDELEYYLDQLKDYQKQFEEDVSFNTIDVGESKFLIRVHVLSKVRVAFYHKQRKYFNTFHLIMIKQDRMKEIKRQNIYFEIHKRFDSRKNREMKRKQMKRERDKNFLIFQEKTILKLPKETSLLPSLRNKILFQIFKKTSISEILKKIREKVSYSGYQINPHTQFVNNQYNILIISHEQFHYDFINKCQWLKNQNRFHYWEIKQNLSFEGTIEDDVFDRLAEKIKDKYGKTITKSFSQFFLKTTITVGDQEAAILGFLFLQRYSKKKIEFDSN